MEKRLTNVAIPDYPSYFGCSHASYKYRIDLYDKDRDIYEPVVYEDDINVARQIAGALSVLVHSDLLVITGNDWDDLEPCDAVILFDNHSEDILETFD